MSSTDDLFSLELDGQAVELFRITGRVAVCELFAFEAVSVTDLDGPNVQDLLGKPFKLGLHNSAGDELTVHGVVTAARCELGDDLLAYHLQLGPQAAPLLLGSNCYVFQDLGADAIIKKVLEAAGLDASSFDFRLKQSYPPRAYTAQYNESDWEFIERLLAEEGIYYFYDFSDDATKLVFADDSTGADPIDGALTLPCREASSLQARREHAVFEVRSRAAISSEGVRLRPTTTTKPIARCSTRKAGDDKHFEVYDFPGRFADPARGTSLAKTRLEALRAERVTVEGHSAVVRLFPGRRFALSEHRVEALNAAYFCVAVEYTALLRSEPGGRDSEDAEGLRLSWQAIPVKVPFRPAPVAEAAHENGRSPNGRRAPAPAARSSTPATPGRSGCSTIGIAWAREIKQLPRGFEPDNFPSATPWCFRAWVGKCWSSTTRETRTNRSSPRTCTRASTRCRTRSPPTRPAPPGKRRPLRAPAPRMRSASRTQRAKKKYF